MAFRSRQYLKLIDPGNVQEERFSPLQLEGGSVFAGVDRFRYAIEKPEIVGRK